MELTDAELNSLADAGDDLLKQNGLERLLNDILKPKAPDGGQWQGGNTEWPKTPDFDGGL